MFASLIWITMMAIAQADAASPPEAVTGAAPLAPFKGQWVLLRFEPTEAGMPGESLVARILDLHVRTVKAGRVIGIRPSQYAQPEGDPAEIELEHIDEMIVECVDSRRGKVQRTFGLPGPNKPNVESLLTIRDVRFEDRRLVVDARYGLHDEDRFSHKALRKRTDVLRYENERKLVADEQGDRRQVRQSEGSAKESDRIDRIGPRSKRIVEEAFRRAPVAVTNTSDLEIQIIPTQIKNDEGDFIEVHPTHSSASSLVDSFRAGAYFLKSITGELEMAPARIAPGERVELIGPHGGEAITSEVIFTVENKYGRVYDRVRSHNDFTIPFEITIDQSDVHEPVAVMLSDWTIERDVDYRYTRSPRDVVAATGAAFTVQETAALVTGKLTHDELAKAASSLFGGTTYRFIPGEAESVESFEREGGSTAHALLTNPTPETRAVRIELEFTGSDAIFSRPFTRGVFDLIIGPNSETMLRVRIDPPEDLSGPVVDPPIVLDLRDRALE